MRELGQLVGKVQRRASVARVCTSLVYIQGDSMWEAEDAGAGFSCYTLGEARLA